MDCSMQNRNAVSRRCYASRRPTVAVVGAIKSTGSKQVVCSKTITAKPDQRKKVEATLAQIVTYGEERAKDRTSGVVSLTCVRDQFEEDVFHCYERYVSNAAMGKHNTDPVMKKLMEEKLLPNLQGPMGWAMYEWKNGKLGNAACPEGPKGEGGLDDATGASGGSGGASMKQTSRAMPVTGGMEDDHDDEKVDAAAVIESVKKGLQSFFSFGNVKKAKK